MDNFQDPESQRKTIFQKATDYFAQARLRARRRKSLWNLVLIPLGFVALAAIWAGLFAGVWAFHTAIYPDHAFRDFGDRISRFGAIVPTFLMTFAIFPGAVGAGFMTANLIMWLIPSARRAFDAEAQGHPGTSFKDTMRSLGKFTVWAMGIGLAIASLAASCLPSLR